MNKIIISSTVKRQLLSFYLFIFLIIAVFPVMAQEKPPMPITVTVSTLQHLSFGTFIQSGASGTVTVTNLGGREATGNIILPNMSSIVTRALFEVTALPGTLITIVNGPDALLKGSNGGTITLKLGEPSTGSPFIATKELTDVFIGGTLTIGDLTTNPAGSYNGIFTVTFIQQ